MNTRDADVGPLEPEPPEAVDRWTVSVYRSEYSARVAPSRAYWFVRFKHAGKTMELPITSGAATRLERLGASRLPDGGGL